jgi:AdoMet-dependent heme synthase
MPSKVMKMNFDQAPMLVIWEVTQACDLACVHCRASAQSEPASARAEHRAGLRLLDQIKSFGNPLMVFTGGDPLKRPDLFELIRYSVKIGLRTNVTPSATPLLTEEGHRPLPGVRRFAHGDQPGRAGRPVARRFPRHSGHLRPGHVGARHARRHRPRNAVPDHRDRRNLARLPEMAEIAKDVGTKMWSLFFLIVTGRALENDGPDRGRIRAGIRFHVRAVEDRAVRHQDHRSHALPPLCGAAHEGRTPLTGERERRAVMWRTAGVSDGKGFVFVSHTGEIFPAGSCRSRRGNVLRDSLTDVYQNSSLFRSLRDTASAKASAASASIRRCAAGRARALMR